MAEIGSNITLAKQFLERGGVIGIPTETVYGLAANALDNKAVAQIFDIKNRPTFDPLIIHTYAINEIYKYVTHIPDKLYQLAKEFMPGALTLLLEKKTIIPDLVTSGLPQVAVRIPNHPITITLLQELEFPLAAPSANPFGYISPTTAIHVAQQLGNKIDYILDGGNCSIGIESTIVGIENDNVIIYRLGGIPVEAIETIVGKVIIKINQASNPKTPGQILSHYAPKKPFILGNINHQIKLHQNQKVAILSFGNTNFNHQIIEMNLSKTGNFSEATTNLFSYMRQLDNSDAEVILAELLPNVGLGRAINDRLIRASAK